VLGHQTAALTKTRELEKGGNMIKKLSMTLLVMAVFGLVGLLADTEAVAECEIAYNCKFVDSNGTESPWSLVAVETGELINTSYRWNYQLIGPPGVSQVVTLAPVCCPDLGYSIEGGAQVLPPGGGDPTTGFGAGDYMSQTIRLAYNVSGTSTFYTFFTSQRVTRLENATMQMKAGKTLYYCKNIAVPACSIGNPYQPEIRLEEFYVKTKKIRVEWDEVGATCNAVKVEHLDGGVWVTVLPGTGPTVDGEAIKDCGPLEGNQKCKRCIVSGGTNSWAWLYIGGNWYYIKIS
jgi:hypothetical protein